MTVVRALLFQILVARICQQNTFGEVPRQTAQVLGRRLSNAELTLASAPFGVQPTSFGHPLVSLCVLDRELSVLIMTPSLVCGP